MTTTGLKSFDETLHLTNAWLHEIEGRMGWEDRAAAYRLLRVSLHILRDRLSVQEAADLAAQLPMLLRGVFYEGWRPSAVPNTVRRPEEFLAPLKEAFSQDPGFDAEIGFREALQVLQRHVTGGEMEDVRRCLPEELRGLFDEFEE
ncbi:MAG: DUF2267 domain-containing protein [Pseudomonadota bacterium]